MPPIFFIRSCRRHCTRPSMFFCSLSARMFWSRCWILCQSYMCDFSSAFQMSLPWSLSKISPKCSYYLYVVTLSISLRNLMHLYFKTAKAMNLLTNLDIMDFTALLNSNSSNTGEYTSRSSHSTLSKKLFSLLTSGLLTRTPKFSAFYICTDTSDDPSSVSSSWCMMSSEGGCC